MYREEFSVGRLVVGTGAASSDPAYAVCESATITVGAEATDVINVAIQLKDGGGNEIATRTSLMAYLSSDATGDTLNTTDANLSSAIGTDGQLVELTADVLFFLVSEVDGDIDIDFTKTDGGTIYLNLIMPGTGRVVTSGAITFAA